MRNLTFHGPGHLLRLPSGRIAERDVETEVTNDDAKAAENAPNIHVTIKPEASGEGPPSNDNEE